ncbi:MAG: recombinase family protein [Firmicutes bacterium]|nr:recombinase family protein [Bacillota bacterium]
MTQTRGNQVGTNDLLHRTAWKSLQDESLTQRFDTVLVFKLDRSVRSVQHTHDTLAIWDPLNLGFLSAQEGFDTTTALGRFLLHLIASPAELQFRHGEIFGLFGDGCCPDERHSWMRLPWENNNPHVDYKTRLTVYTGS